MQANRVTDQIQIIKPDHRAREPSPGAAIRAKAGEGYQ